MPTSKIDRRLLLGGMALAGAAAAASAEAQPAPTPAAGGFAPQPLPFDPKSVPGLSEKLLTSHHDNNYAGAVRRIGAIRAEFAKLDPATAPGFQINGLKREELLAWNSMILHEVYFAGLAGGVAPSAPLGQAIERDFGGMAKWAAEFAGVGKALGGGSGWVLLTWSPHDRRLVNTWASDHTQTLAGGTPLLALDMYEHAYHMDYGAKAAAYVDAVMKVISWGRANEAFRRASAA
ncbi:MAG: superoxide dismutase [Phenylobacterium sp.]